MLAKMAFSGLLRNSPKSVFKDFIKEMNIDLSDLHENITEGFKDLGPSGSAAKSAGFKAIMLPSDRSPYKCAFSFAGGYCL